MIGAKNADVSLFDNYWFSGPRVSFLAGFFRLESGPRTNECQPFGTPCRLMVQQTSDSESCEEPG
jgi:hypothetical protein